MTALIIQADARALPLADSSVDLIVTSPPYYGLRSYTDGGEHYDGQIGAEKTPAEYVAALIECTREWMRVLKPTGSIWVNLGDKYGGAAWENKNATASSGLTGGVQVADRKAALSTARPIPGTRYKSLIGLPWRYAIRCIDELGLILRAELIWSKCNGLPESVTDRVRRSHETWFHFTVQPRYFASVDAIREAPARIDPPRRLGTRNQTQRHLNATDNVGWKDHLVSGNPLGRLPGSVREVATQPLNVPVHLGTDHFAAFPVEWPRWIISAWSPADGTVLDPFGGTGTTALAAKALGRRGISIDRSEDYCRIAQWRTTDPGELAKAMRVEKPPAQLVGQSDLLELIGGAS